MDMLNRVSTSLLAILFVPVMGAGCAQTTTERLGLGPLQTVRDFDLTRYDGRWYEIGSYPNSFQEGCTATTADYVLRDNGEVGVTNTCVVDGSPNVAEGVARPVDLDEGKLEVSFFGPFFGDYWILELGEPADADDDYRYAVVSSPSRDFLWILSRTPSLDDELLDDIFARLETQGLDRERFVFTPQPAR